MRIYESSEAPDAAPAKFDCSMAQRGWTRMKPARLADASHVYTHHSGVSVFATAATSKLKAGTVFSLVEMGAPNAPNAPR